MGLSTNLTQKVVMRSAAQPVKKGVSCLLWLWRQLSKVGENNPDAIMLMMSC